MVYVSVHGIWGHVPLGNIWNLRPLREEILSLLTKKLMNFHYQVWINGNESIIDLMILGEDSVKQH